jgi:hypothetical protein
MRDHDRSGPTALLGRGTLGVGDRLLGRRPSRLCGGAWPGA